MSPLLAARCAPAPASHLAALARHWAATRGQARSHVFLGPENTELQTLTYAQLDLAAQRLAATLAVHAPHGARAVLMFPSGLEFVIAFFACHYAGLIPVPVVPARGRRMREAALSVLRDCEPEVLLAPAEYLDAAAAHLAELACTRCTLVPVDFAPTMAGSAASTNASTTVGPALRGERPHQGLAFIQYTSGSTSTPKGVCVSQTNLLANLRMIHSAVANPVGVTYVGWAPLHHDMGLIGNLLAPFYLGGLCVLMSPAQFAGSPNLWLRAISHYRARTSGGPNFAYDLCIAQAQRILREPLDLSCWKVAFCSGEPVRAKTMLQFVELFAASGLAPAALYPAFGLAEATLFASGGTTGRPATIALVGKEALAQGSLKPAAAGQQTVALVGCGHAAPGSSLAIVDADSGLRKRDGDIGEIWLSGDHIPECYWRKPEASQKTFHAQITASAEDRRYLRTGDLGAVFAGELFVTGRLKDLMIVRGKNIYPQDIERLAATCAPGLTANSSAAFLALDADAHASMALVLEVERSWRHRLDQAEVAAAIRQAVFREFECTMHNVVFVEPGSIPKTSSGKIRRSATRQALLDGTLQRLAAKPQVATS